MLKSISYQFYDTYIILCLESIASYYQLDVEAKTMVKVNTSKPTKMTSNSYGRKSAFVFKILKLLLKIWPKPTN
jgi:hypothetical protein